MKKSITFLLAVFFATACMAQEKRILTIGDPMPEVQYSKWLKGTPFKPDQKDMVYVYEFWATWCGPCVDAMPHLSELAKKYKGKAQIVGVNISERTKDQPYESAIPAVEKFVAKNADRMDYNVIMDNNARHMAKNWLAAADRRGIPATMVIKNGIIQWIGHPLRLDGPLDSLVNGTFDLAAFKKKYENGAQASREKNAQRDRILKAVKEAGDAGNFELMAKRIEDGVKEVPNLSVSLKLNMLLALLRKKMHKEAFAYGEKLWKEFPHYKSGIAMYVIAENNLEQESYLKALEWIKSDPDAKNRFIFESMADGYVKVGDYKSAIAAMEKAIANVQEELKDERKKNSGFDFVLEGYKTKLQELKKKQ